MYLLISSEHSGTTDVDVFGKEGGGVEGGGVEGGGVGVEGGGGGVDVDGCSGVAVGDAFP